MDETERSQGSYTAHDRDFTRMHKSLEQRMLRVYARRAQGEMLSRRYSAYASGYNSGYNSYNSGYSSGTTSSSDGLSGDAIAIIVCAVVAVLCFGALFVYNNTNATHQSTTSISIHKDKLSGNEVLEDSVANDKIVQV